MPSDASKSASRSAAKDVICELIAASLGELHGKVRLNKAFYFAHLYYWRDAGAVLTDYPIVRLPLGPCIDDANDLLSELVTGHKLSITAEPVGPYEEYVYRLLDKTVSVDPATSRGKAIFAAVNFVQGKSGAELSEITHEHSRSWRATPDGHEMGIYIDLVHDDEFAAIRQKLKAVREREGELWPAAF